MKKQKTYRPQEEYDIHSEIEERSHKKIINTTYLGFEIEKHPQILKNVDYFELRQKLNKEQQKIVKKVVMKKTFIAKPIYKALLCIYNNNIDNNP